MRPGSSVRAIAWDPWRKIWAVSVTSPAQEGRANREVAEYVGELLELPVGSVRLESGARSPEKILRIEGLDPGLIEARLQRCSGKGS